jgi:hypothetical protein
VFGEQDDDLVVAIALGDAEAAGDQLGCRKIVGDRQPRELALADGQMLSGLDRAAHGVWLGSRRWVGRLRRLFCAR